MKIKLAGVTYIGPLVIVQTGEATIVHEKNNKFDDTALSVRQNDQHIGYIPSKAGMQRIERDLEDVRAEIVSCGRRNQYNSGRLTALHNDKNDIEEARAELLYIRENFQRADVTVVDYDLSHKHPYVSVEIEFDKEEEGLYSDAMCLSKADREAGL